MTLLFIRQQGNGPERNANLTPRGIFPAGASADGDAPREKGCRIRSGPFLEMLPMKRRKTMNADVVEKTVKVTPKKRRKMTPKS